MSRGSSACLVRWPNRGTAKLLVGIAASGGGGTTASGKVMGQEARNARLWTFMLDFGGGGNVTGTIEIFGTIDFASSGDAITAGQVPPAGNWFSIGKWVNPTTDSPPILFDKPTLGVWAQITGFTAGGPLDVLGAATLH